MLYNVRQSYTPPLKPHEFNEHSLIIDTETVGSGPEVEVVEIALCDYGGQILYDSLVRPVYSRPPKSTREQRFDPAEFAAAPDWPEVWAAVAPLSEGRLLVAYNAAFDRRALAAMRSRHHQSAPERGWRCAMHMVRRAAGLRKSLTLTEACALYRLEGGTHRAARDVLATHRLLSCVIPTRVEPD